MTTRPRPQVAIIHPWLPQYRLKFFAQLIEGGSASGIDVRVFHGQPRGSLGARGDSAEDEASISLPSREWKLAKRSLVWRSLASLRPFRQWDLIICEQAIGNMDTYIIAASSPRRFALWGHGGDYVSEPGRLGSLVKRRLTLRSRWFFAYTDAGGRMVESYGTNPDRITVVNNSIDTVELTRQLDSVSLKQIKEFRESINAGDRAIICSIGGIDEAKRPDLLIDVADELSRNRSDVMIVAAGGGQNLLSLRQICNGRDNIEFVGRTTGIDKAILLRSSVIMLNPGRVGLVALDSLMAGLPVLTSEWRWHAPEIEYLRAARTVIEVQDSQLATEVSRLLDDQFALEEMRRRAESVRHLYSIEDMADRFLDGIRGYLASPSG